MVWDRNQPTTATKLRNVPSVITPNWDAIEFGDVPYDKLQLEEQGVNPTRQTNRGWLFTKEAASQTELYYEDDRNPARVTQLTSNGRIGVTTQQMLTSGISFNGTYFNTQNSFVSAWAVVNSGGTLASGFGLTSVRNSTGDYTLTITTPLSSANYVVSGMVFTTATRARVLYCYSRNAGNFSVRTQAVNASAGSYENNNFMVAVFGGR